MPQQPQSPDPRREAARQGGTWTEEEKSRGAAPGGSAGAAGEAVPKGGYGGDARAATEAAAAGGSAGAPDPETPVGGGKGHASMGGSATEPEGDPQAPRNPA